MTSTMPPPPPPPPPASDSGGGATAGNGSGGGGASTGGFLYFSGPPPDRPRRQQGYTPTVYNGKPTMNQEEYDGKRLRKSSMRKTVDYNPSVIKYLEDRVWQRGVVDRPALQPDVLFYPELVPPAGFTDNPINAVTTRFVRTATNKMRCPIFCLAWTPEGRRLITGASSGEFTLWNGLTFNFETILQAHDTPVRTMVWSRSDQWMVTGDHGGYIKYWQMNMNNVKMFQAHKDPIRGISFSPSDNKVVTCSDDGTVRIWDFVRCYEEKVLRGHGADVKCVDWHPHKGLVVSGSKDNQQPVRLWDPKSGQSLATLHAHKSTVMDLSFNRNGNWLLTASRDHLIKIYDIRNLSQEMQVFRGHKKEAASVRWHPIHETLFASGGSDGSLMFWSVGCEKEVGSIEQAHDSLIWCMSWHPLGHVLASGSNDHTTKFWTRNRPGDTMQDKYNLNMDVPDTGRTDEEGRVHHPPPTHPERIPKPPPVVGVVASTETTAIPGMAPEDRVDPEAVSADRDGEDGGIPALGDKRPPVPRYAPRTPHWKFASHWHERWEDDHDRGGRGGWRGRGRGEWRGRGRGGRGGGFRDHEDVIPDELEPENADEHRTKWSERGGYRPDSREGGREPSVDDQPARDRDLRPPRDLDMRPPRDLDMRPPRDLDMRPPRDLDMRTGGGGEGRGPHGRRPEHEGRDRPRHDRDVPGHDDRHHDREDMDVGGYPPDANGHQEARPADRHEAGFRGRGGFRDGERGGFGVRGGVRDGVRDGFSAPEGRRDGFHQPGGDRERDQFGPREEERGHYPRQERFVSERGAGGGSFRGRDDDRDGRVNGERPGHGGRGRAGRGGGLLEHPDPPPRGEWLLEHPDPLPRGEWRGAAGGVGGGWRGRERGEQPGWRDQDEGYAGGAGGASRGAWRPGDATDDAGWRGGRGGGGYRGRGGFREDDRGGWRGGGRGRSRGRGRGEF